MKQGIQFLLAILFPFLSACATLSSLSHFPEAPQAYGGLRVITNERTTPYRIRHQDQGSYEAGKFGEMWIGGVWMPTYFDLDVNASFVIDTLLLPVTIPAEFFFSDRIHEMITLKGSPVRSACARCRQHSIDPFSPCPGVLRDHGIFFPYNAPKVVYMPNWGHVFESEVYYPPQR